TVIGDMEANVKTGRLEIDRTGATVQISKDPTTVFGFGNITSISTTIGKATLTAAPNPSITLPNEVRSGESVSFGLTLPDGTTTAIRLSPVDRSPNVGQFQITPDAAET